MEITPDDSASQIGAKVSQCKPKGSSRCDSTFSRASNTSSISAARAKEAARIAEILSGNPRLEASTATSRNETSSEKARIRVAVKEG